MKKEYRQPIVRISMPVIEKFMAGDNSIPFGGEDGPGIAEGKERQDSAEQNDDWGSLW